jgi:hypothetical protein
MSPTVIARPLAAALLGLLAQPAAGSGPPPRTML